MAYTYDPKLPTARHWIRWRIGDNVKSTHVLDDEEIDAAIADQGDKRYAAAMCAEAIAGRLSNSVDKRVGRLAISGSQKSERYFALAAQIRREADEHAVPYAGGLSESERETDAEDADLIQPSFRKGMHDNLGEDALDNEFRV